MTELKKIVGAVIGAVKLLKKGKAAGHDGITPQMIKCLESNGVEMLTNLFNNV